MVRKVVLLSISIIICSCAANRYVQKMNDGGEVESKKFAHWNKADGFDSETGTIQYKDEIFSYDYGKYTNLGPQTELEYFTFSFRGNYYYHFFEKIHIEEKLAKGYIDSVNVIDIKPNGSFIENKIKECTTCNFEALLQFRGRLYIYPFYFYNGDKSEYDIKIDTVNSYLRKYYISKNEPIKMGLVLQPIKGNTKVNVLGITNNNVIDIKQSKLFLYGLRIN